jgi:hypothetical protein
VVKIPIGGKSLERPDCYRLVEFAAATPSLAGVMTDAAANSRERITLPDGVDGLQILTSGNLSYIFGNIDSYRTGMLARRYHEGIAYSGRAFLLFYVSFIFISEVIEGGKDGIRRALTQAT